MSGPTEKAARSSTHPSVLTLMALGLGRLFYRADSRKRVSTAAKVVLGGRATGRTGQEQDRIECVCGSPTNSIYTSTHAVERKRRPEATEEVSGRSCDGRPRRALRRRANQQRASSMVAPATEDPATGRSRAESSRETSSSEHPFIKSIGAQEVDDRASSRSVTPD